MTRSSPGWQTKISWRCHQVPQEIGCVTVNFSFHKSPPAVSFLYHHLVSAKRNSISIFSSLLLSDFALMLSLCWVKAAQCLGGLVPNIGKQGTSLTNEWKKETLKLFTNSPSSLRKRAFSGENYFAGFLPQLFNSRHNFFAELIAKLRVGFCEKNEDSCLSMWCHIVDTCSGHQHQVEIHKMIIFTPKYLSELPLAQYLLSKFIWIVIFFIPKTFAQM